MAEEFTLEGLNESQLKAYNEYLKLPNFTKEIAFDLVTEKITPDEAGDLLFEGDFNLVLRIYNIKWLILSPLWLRTLSKQENLHIKII
jgi:hypothetical protein